MSRFSSTGIPGQSWRPSGTRLMWRFTRSSDGNAVMSSPAKRIRPLRTGNVPAMAFSVVVFPAPFAPIIQVTPPLATDRETPQSTCATPRYTSRFSTCKSFSPAGSATQLAPRAGFAQIGFDHGLIILDLLRLPFRQLLAEVKNGDSVANGHHGFHIMLNVHYGYAAFTHAMHQIQHGAGLGAGESAADFIEQQQFG